MSQLPQPLVKHPANSPNPLLITTTTSDAPFVPRKEFIKDNRVASSFSLLALSGAGFVRLYSFSAAVITALRRLFDQKNLITGVRENAPRHFFEFALDGKPWSRPKSITSEKIIIDILTIIFHCGYAFLSTIDYGREQDDRLAIAFSKPCVPGVTPALLMQPNASATSLNQSSIRTPFAISFSSANLLRVVGPPLHSTPAVLQAVRGAWPRGVVSEKKVGDATFEFRLKGYKWFQEDTFATDSLHHILGLLSALDSHGFTLLTSITLSTRSRVKDMWIFTGLAGDDYPGSVPPTPTTVNGETRRDAIPYPAVIPGPSPLSGNAEKRVPPRLYPIPPVTNESDVIPPSAKQSASQLARLHMLHKPSPSTSVPVAFVPEYPPTAAVDAIYPSVSSRMSAAVDLPLSLAPAARMVRSLSNPSSVGSVDMTGIGAARGRQEPSGKPDVIYATDGHQNGVHAQEYKTYEGRPGGEPPHAAFVESPRTRRASLESRMALADRRPSLRPSVTRSSTLPLASTSSSSTTNPQIQTTPNPQIQIHAPSPVVAREGANHGNGALGTAQGLKVSPKEQPPDAPRSPTPHLLPPGTFRELTSRDSAFSSVTGRQSQEVSITWTGRDPEPGRRDRHGEQRSHSEAPTRQPPPHVDAGSRADMERAGSGPSTGGWAVPTPRDDRNDVGHKMFPTIREQPSKEGDELTMSNQHAARRMQLNERRREQEEAMAQRAAYRRDEAELAGPSTRKTDGAAVVKHPAEERSRPDSRRRETTMSGWVLVNVETSTPVSEKPGTPQPGGRQKSASQSPPATRPGTAQHLRSHSDTRILTSSPPAVGHAPVAATMSATAKTIAMIDAVGAREEKASSAFKRIFHRAKPSNDSREHSQSPPGTWSRKTPEQAAPRSRAVDSEERMLRAQDRTRGVPAATRAGGKRMSMD